jgi:hypothetical protein
MDGGHVNTATHFTHHQPATFDLPPLAPYQYWTKLCALWQQQSLLAMFEGIIWWLQSLDSNDSMHGLDPKFPTLDQGFETGSSQ